MIGVVLAGGLGRRLGGAGKATVLLAGRPLAAYPAGVLAEVCERVAVVCRVETEVPDLPGVERWDEPDGARHPARGLGHALERAAGPVLVCAVDMPFVTPDACRSLLMAAGGSGGARAVVASAGGVLQPVLGVYSPEALGELRSAAPDAPLRDTVEHLRPVRVALPPRIVAGVNTPEELAVAEARLAGGPWAQPASS